MKTILRGAIVLILAAAAPATAKQLGVTTGPAFSISKRTLHGGKQEGSALIEVNNGKITFLV